MHKGIMKHILASVIMVSMTGGAYAIAPGLYLGLMAGPATNGAESQNVQVLPYPTAGNPDPVVSIANPRSSQFGSRFFMGYKFNHYAGFEMGFSYFSGVNYSLVDSSLQAAAGTTARVRGIDLLGKLDYTFQNTMGVFGGAGVVASYVTTPGGLNPTGYSSVPAPIPQNPANMRVTNAGSNTYTTKLSPAFTVGATYDLNQSWVLSLSWLRYLVGGNVSNMDLYGLGLSYHFTDKYCGQFLCDD